MLLFRFVTSLLLRRGDECCLKAEMDVSGRTMTVDPLTIFFPTGGADGDRLLAVEVVFSLSVVK